MSEQVLLDLNEIADKIVEIAKEKMQMNDEKLTLDDIACLISGIDKPSNCNDYISRQAVLEQIKGWLGYELKDMTNPIYYLEKRIKALPSVAAEQTHEEWCTDCKEYDQEQHCCHRYCKVIRQAIAEIKQTERTGHCKDCKYFEYDSVAKVDGIPLIVAHEICSKWGEGCKTKEDGYCFLFEPQERSDKE